MYNEAKSHSGSNGYSNTFQNVTIDKYVADHYGQILLTAYVHFYVYFVSGKQANGWPELTALVFCLHHDLTLTKT